MRGSPLRRWRLGRLPLRGAGLHTADATPSPEEIGNARLFLYEAPLTNLALGVAPSFYALFAMQLGGSNATVGWLTSGPALVNLLWLIPCGRLLQYFRHYGYSLAWSAFLQRMLIMALALVPALLPAGLRAWAVVAVVALAAMPTGMWAISFHAASGELFSPRHLTRLVGQRWAAANVSSVLGAFALGQLVERLPFPANFQVLFVGVGLLTLGTAYLVMRLHFPPRAVAAAPAAGLPTWASLRQGIRQYRSFARFEIGVGVIYLAIFSAQPLMRIYWVRDLGAGGEWVGALTAALALGMTLGNLYWGRLSRPGRDRYPILISAIGYAGLFALLAAAFPTLPLLLGVGVFAGFMGGGCELMIFNRTVQLSPRAGRATFISVHQLIINLAAFLGPLFSTGLIDVWGTRPMLVVVGGVGLLGAGLMTRLGWGPAPAEPVSALSAE